MNKMEPRPRLDHAGSGGTLRRIAVTAGLVLLGLILFFVAIYAGAFIILAPMMQ